MPKVTAAYREARRDEIARAAMRCLARNGFANTSMADIIAESELSAGSIYSHFASKAEIAQYVARIVLSSRSEELMEYAEQRSSPPTPAEIIVFLLDTVARAGVSKALLLQLWAESTVDSEFRAMLNDTLGQLRDAYTSAALPWLTANGLADDEHAVQRAVSTMLTLSQGYIAHSALFGDSDPAMYLGTAGRLLQG